MAGSSQATFQKSTLILSPQGEEDGLLFAIVRTIPARLSATPQRICCVATPGRNRLPAPLAVRRRPRANRRRRQTLAQAQPVHGGPTRPRPTPDYPGPRSRTPAAPDSRAPATTPATAPASPATRGPALSP